MKSAVKEAMVKEKEYLVKVQQENNRAILSLQEENLVIGKKLGVISKFLTEYESEFDTGHKAEKKTRTKYPAGMGPQDTALDYIKNQYPSNVTFSQIRKYLIDNGMQISGSMLPNLVRNGVIESIDKGIYRFKLTMQAGAAQ